MQKALEQKIVGLGAGKVGLYVCGWLDEVVDFAYADTQLVARMAETATTIRQDEDHAWRTGDNNPTISIEFGDGGIDGTKLMVDGIKRMECRVIPDKGLSDEEMQQYIRSCASRTMLVDDKGTVSSFQTLCMSLSNNLMYLIEQEVDEIRIWWEDDTIKTRIVGFGEVDERKLYAANKDSVDL